MVRKQLLPGQDQLVTHFWTRASGDTSRILGSVDSILIWSAGEAGLLESRPGLGSGEAFQQGDLALIALFGDREMGGS